MKKLSTLIVLLLALSGCIDDASIIEQVNASESNSTNFSIIEETGQEFGEIREADVNSERLDILDNYIGDMKYDVKSKWFVSLR